MIISRSILPKKFFFFKIYLLFVDFIYFWLHRVLVAARRIFAVACGLLSSCGMQVFSLYLWLIGSRARELCSLWHAVSLVEACKISSCGAWAQLPHSMWDLSSPARD